MDHSTLALRYSTLARRYKGAERYRKKILAQIFTETVVLRIMLQNIDQWFQLQITINHLAAKT